MAVQDGIEARDVANVAWARDRERLLPGERPETRYLDDAEHWISVYSDLLAFNRMMVQAIQERLASTLVTSEGPEYPDLVLLHAHVRRLRWRLRFWRQRMLSLRTGFEADPADTKAAPR